jgi:hypothetical protein
MAGASVVVVVCAATGAGLETASGAGAVVARVAGNIVGGVVEVGAVLTAVAAAVTGCGAAGLKPVLVCAGDRVPRAATVPPTPPSTTTTATVATTILFRMDGMLRHTYQPKVNAAATSPGGSGSISLASWPPSSVHSAHMDLEEIEAIRQLKYRYFRLLDTKRFIELGQLLTDDATTSYQSGELSYQGRDAIVAFLEESLGSGDIVTMHNGHHPEIELTGPTTATGVWYLEDRVVVRAMDFEIVGTLLYDDRYVKVDGEWKIEHTGYERIFEEHRRFSDGQLHSFRARFDAT